MIERKMRKSLGVSCVLAAVFLFGCGEQGSQEGAGADRSTGEEAGDAAMESDVALMDAPIDAATKARARAALLPLKRDLLAALSGAMAEGGPVKAIEVCKVEAPELAAAASGDGVEVGRTSHRLRNPENAPAAWMEPLLKVYLEHPADTTSHTVPFPDGRIGYVEPIHMKPICTTCHGAEVEADLRVKLQELYPQDQATGFESGDFRGLFWVTLPRAGG